MWELYDALIDGVGDETVRFACAGNLRACIGTDSGAGVCSLIGPQADRPPIILNRFDGRPLREVAALCKSWDFFEAALGTAALNCWYNRPMHLRNAVVDSDADAFRSLEPFCRGKRVATIGHFPGTHELFSAAKELRIFEREPKPGDFPDAAEEFLLPDCEVVFLTGMTFTNKTLVRLLDLCRGAETVLVGPSVPLAPALFGHGVDHLSGMLVTDPTLCRERILSPEAGPRGFFTAAQKVLFTRD